MRRAPTAGQAAVIAAAAMAAGGLLAPSWLIFLLTIALGEGLAVLGLMLLWRAGLVSFGQALYFAGGAYAGGLFAQWSGTSDALLFLAIATASGGLLAFLCGFLLARYRAIFFAMLSLALSMVLYGFLVNAQSLGSTDGIGLAPPSLFGRSLGEDPVLILFLLTLALCLGAALLVQLYLRSIRGRLSAAIRDNEIRVEYLGASVRQLIHGKLVIAGALAGLGGGITALAVGHIDPEMAYWTTSGGFVFVTVLAGTGSVLAPFLGAILFESLRSLAMTSLPEYWQIALGSALLLVILFLPNGLWSLIARPRREERHAAR